MKDVIIGIAAGRKYDNYQKWILESGAQIVKLSYSENNLSEIRKCNGVVLTGGEDVHPKCYGKPEYKVNYELDDPDERRDEFELKVLDFVEEYELPLLGICRGLQIANVHFGGTLIPDIPSFGKPDHAKFEEGKDRYHLVQVEPESLLSNITGTNQGEVNSAHHQAVDKVGSKLRISARSADGIVEALEWGQQNPFLMLVQWHPERMSHPDSPFSVKIRDQFLKACAL